MAGVVRGTLLTAGRLAKDTVDGGARLGAPPVPARAPHGPGPGRAAGLG
jgi:hypothetical protein